MLSGMAFTSTDLAAIDAAIASGELSVRTADGKQVTMTVYQLNPEILVREESRKISAWVNRKDIVALAE